jgi:hypothetical protein
MSHNNSAICNKSLNPLKVHLHEFVTDSSNKSGHWLFRKLLIGYDADTEDTNCQVYESGDIIEETVVNNTTIITDDDDISSNNMKYNIFLCVSQLNEYYVHPQNHALHKFFVRNILHINY